MPFEWALLDLYDDRCLLRRALRTNNFIRLYVRGCYSTAEHRRYISIDSMDFPRISREIRINRGRNHRVILIDENARLNVSSRQYSEEEREERIVEYSPWFHPFLGLCLVPSASPRRSAGGTGAETMRNSRVNIDSRALILIRHLVAYSGNCICIYAVVQRLRTLSSKTESSYRSICRSFGSIKTLLQIHGSLDPMSYISLWASREVNVTVFLYKDDRRSLGSIYR